MLDPISWPLLVYPKVSIPQNFSIRGMESTACTGRNCASAPEVTLNRPLHSAGMEMNMELTLIPARTEMPLATSNLTTCRPEALEASATNTCRWHMLPNAALNNMRARKNAHCCQVSTMMENC